MTSDRWRDLARRGTCPDCGEEYARLAMHWQGPRSLSPLAPDIVELLADLLLGDGFVQKWGAFAGEAIGDPDRSDAESWGREPSYRGPWRRRSPARSRTRDPPGGHALRARRPGGPTVYMHTNALPAWIEDGEDPVLAGEGRVIGTWSDGMR